MEIVTTVTPSQEAGYTIAQYPLYSDEKGSFHINPDLMRPGQVYQFDFLEHEWSAFKERDDDQIQFFYTPKGE